VKELYLELKQRINDKSPEIQHVAIFNNQIDLLENIYTEGQNYQNTTELFPTPAVFFEFESPSEIHQLGNGVQLYDPLNIKVHIVHTFFNGENYGENLEVFDVKLSVFKALQKFEPKQSVPLVRILEEQDSDHTSIYHYVMTFLTNYMDNSMNEPVDPGKTIQPPIEVELDLDLKIDNNVIRTGTDE
jgi:hypothetical protein